MLFEIIIMNVKMIKNMNSTNNQVQMIRKEYIDKYIIYSFNNAKRLDILNTNIIKEIIEKDIRRISINSKNTPVINLKGIKFIDSHGFRVFLGLIILSDIYNKPLYFSNISGEVKELIHLLKLEEEFNKRTIILPFNRTAA
jgi:anti-anti-sigma regulatory factor